MRVAVIVLRKLSERIILIVEVIEVWRRVRKDLSDMVQYGEVGGCEV